MQKVELYSSIIYKWFWNQTITINFLKFAKNSERLNVCYAFQTGFGDPGQDDIVSKGDENDDLAEFLEGDTEDVSDNPPVFAAVIAAISWLFFCAGLFTIWEDWTYWISFYFFFISWSTIGKLLQAFRVIKKSFQFCHCLLNEMIDFC